jgi:hypothetical protein
VSGAAGTPLGASGGGGKGPGDASVGALMSEVRSLRAQVQQLADLLATAVPSYPASPSSSRLVSSP